MNLNTHPGLAELLMFQDAALPPKQREPLADHMRVCAQCRDKIISLLTLKNSLAVAPEDVKPIELSAECVPMELMGDYLGGRLAAGEWERYSTHTQQCDICFERAAYYSHSSVKMTDGVLRMEPTPLRFLQAVAPGITIKTNEERITVKESAVGRIWRWVTSPIPAYAFAATLFLFLAFGGRGPLVVDLGSHQAFSIYEPSKSPGPSFGFSDAGRKVGEAGAGLAVNLSGDAVNFSWNGVEGAEEYRLVISELDPSGPREVVTIKTGQPGAHVDLGQLSPGKAYRWNVHGVRMDNNVFSATGQFAIAKP
ncbi:MAG: hypothetical protein OEV92_09615 [Nitrospinota bacterium]|nr:hypothetical protein [Nitrospinota bacterium]